MINNIIYNWNKEKNVSLIENRGVSFEEVIFAIRDGNILDIIKNPSNNFDNQYCYTLKISDYIYLVPFVIKGDEYFLKTIFPSRKYNKVYGK